MIKKMRGHSGEKIARKSRISCRVNGRGCGCTGTVDSGSKCAHSWNQIQMLKECLCCHIYCCHIYCAHRWPRLAVIGTASCAVSNRESRYPHHHDTATEEQPPKLINLGFFLEVGSSSSGFLLWKPLNKERGWGFLSINLC